jgi:uncharacterized peroxidase-related enzyme
MSIINTVSDDAATGDIAAIYAEDREHHGYVPTRTRIMAVNPEAHLAFEDLTKAIASQLGVRNYRLVTLAAADALNSDECRLAHGDMARKIMDDAQIERVARDFHDADLTEAEVAMMEFAQKVCGDSAAMTDADSQILRDHGFSDRDIVDITLAAAVRNYYSRALQALAVPLDVPPTLPESLREALVSSP